MDALAELQNRISLLAFSNASIGAFGEWLIDRMWDVEQSSNKEVRSAFYVVEGILAEASHAKWNDLELREELANTIRPVDVSALVIRERTSPIPPGREKRLNMEANAYSRVFGSSPPLSGRNLGKRLQRDGSATNLNSVVA